MKLKTIISVGLVLVLLLTINLVVFAAHPFVDVADDSWYNEAVDYVYENELMSGTSGVSFGPDMYMSRGMLVTVLYRLAGSPETNAGIPFADVAENAYYCIPVKWCYDNGIVAGTSESTFSPNVNISREQMVTIFAQYAVYMGLDPSHGTDLHGYADKNDVSAYAMNAFEWAVSSGIISGTSATTLSPQGTATRAQCAVIIQRFIAWAEANTSDPTVTPVVSPEMTPVATPIITPEITPTLKPTAEPTTTPILGENQTPFG